MISVEIHGTIPRPLTRDEICGAFRAAAKACRRTASGSVSIAFVTAARMTELNRIWRKKKGSTDVLSFAPAEAFPESEKRTEQPLGDLFLDPGYVRREARSRQIPFREEVLRDIVHGALHLFGYDHATDAQEKRMFTLQEGIVTSFLKHA